MLRFFEPEAEPRWLASADHYKCSRMQNNPVFPLRSPSLLAGTSSVASELERVNCYINNGDFFNVEATQDCNSFMFESFSPSPSMNQTSSGQVSLTTGPVHLGASGLTSHQDLMSDGKKPRKIPDETLILGRESKRCKAARDDKLQSRRMATTMKEPVSSLKKSQKLGDKITALQQLVSPFGKTDTASVLQEACVHIKALHEQIRVLSSPYFGSKTSGFQAFRSISGNIAGEKLSLQGRGLCLVPVSSSTIKSLADQEPFDRRTLERTAWESGLHLY